MDGAHDDVRMVVVPSRDRLMHFARLVVLLLLVASAVSKVPAVVVRLHFGRAVRHLLLVRRHGNDALAR